MVIDAGSILQRSILQQENKQLRERLRSLKMENARLLAHKKKSIALIKDLIADALDATFKVADAETLLKSCSQKMTAISAQACLMSWAYQTDEHPVKPADQAKAPAQFAKLTLVKSLKQLQKARTPPF